MKKGKFLAVIALIALTGFLWMACDSGGGTSGGGGGSGGGGTTISEKGDDKAIVKVPDAAAPAIYVRVDAINSTGVVVTDADNGSVESQVLRFIFSSVNTNDGFADETKRVAVALDLSQIKITNGTGKVINTGTLVPLAGAAAPLPALTSGAAAKSEWGLRITTDTPGTITVSVNNPDVATNSKELVVFSNDVAKTLNKITAAIQDGGVDNVTASTGIKVTLQTGIMGLTASDFTITPTAVGGASFGAKGTATPNGAYTVWTIPLSDVKAGDVTVKITKAGFLPTAFTVTGGLYGPRATKVKAELGSVAPKEAGVDFTVKLTVQKTVGLVDSTYTDYNGIKAVTVSGLVVAPDGSYGAVASASGPTPITGASPAVNVNFIKGEAIVTIKLYNAAAPTSPGLVFTLTDTVGAPATADTSAAPLVIPKLTASTFKTVEFISPAGALDATTVRAPSTGGTKTFADAPAVAPRVVLRDAYENPCSDGPSKGQSVRLNIFGSPTTGTVSLTNNTANGNDDGQVIFSAATLTNTAKVEGLRFSATAANVTTSTQTQAIALLQAPVTILSVEPYPAAPTATTHIIIHLSGKLEATTSSSTAAHFTFAAGTATGYDLNDASTADDDNGVPKQDIKIQLDIGSQGGTATLVSSNADLIVIEAAKNITIIH